MSAGAIYAGRVRHARIGARVRRFGYRLWMLLVDLDELEALRRRGLLRWLDRSGLLRFRRSDFLGAPQVPLKEAVLARVEESLGFRPAGPVRLLAQWRQLGWAFNPVAFYYCYGLGGVELEAIVAEITNTPWGERHAYVLDARGGARSFRFAKRFHVSPFFGMDHEYLWQLGAPGEELHVHMTNLRRGERVHEASLALARKPLDAPQLARALLLHPWMPARTSLAIYWQALLLWIARTPFFPHPTKLRPTAPVARTPS